MSVKAPGRDIDHCCGMKRIISLLVVLGLSAGASVAHGASLGDGPAGHELAEKICADCHIIAPGGKPRRLVGAPDFPVLALDPRVSDFRIRAFLRTPHQIMPNFVLSDEDLDDLIAYILSLKPKPTN